jgi:hypothetical protein
VKYDGTATDVLDARPLCDLCKEQGRERPAAIDGKTTFGPWAYLCIEHYDTYGVGLGVGRGQRLLIDPPESA